MVEPRYAGRAMTPADDGHRNGAGAGITANEGQRRQWNDDVRLSAWRHREPMTAGVTAVLLEHAGLQAEEKVLDVGSGSGRSAIAAAHQVAPLGEVVGADISERAGWSAIERATYRQTVTVDREALLDDDAYLGYYGVAEDRLAEARAACERHLAPLQRSDGRYDAPLAFQVFTALN
jgi:protein-L-isoaspartate O-methyltransferase